METTRAQANLRVGAGEAKRADTRDGATTDGCSTGRGMY